VLRRGHRIAGIALMTVLLAGGAARAQDEDRPVLRPILLTLQGGAMFPAGQQGKELDPGTQLGGSLGYQLSDTFTLTGDLGYVSSSDALGTRIHMAGIHGRFNPSPDWRQLFVTTGVGFYRISYRPDPGELAPSDLTRPGMNFGMGYDLLELSNLSFGLTWSYHGIVIARRDALAYVNVGAYITGRTKH
jgi:hypothetical protein